VLSLHAPRTVNDARLQTVDVAAHALPLLLADAEAEYARTVDAMQGMLAKVKEYDSDLEAQLSASIQAMSAHSAILAQSAVLAARALDAHRDLNLQTAAAVLGNMSSEAPAASSSSSSTPTPPSSSSHIQHMRGQVAACGDVGILGLLEWASAKALLVQKTHIADAFARTSEFLCRPETSMRAALQLIREHPHCGEAVLHALVEAELLVDHRKTGSSAHTAAGFGVGEVASVGACK
jgi:hypothetical protein